MSKSIFDPSLHFGHVVSTKTREGHSFEGELYCYETNLKFIIIKEEGKNGTANFYIIKTDIIVDIEIVRRIKILFDPLPQIERSLIEKIEQKALADFESVKARIGIGVTQEAQELFDFIWKTHPDCAWSNKDILVLNGEVRIKPPYGPDNCVAKNENLKERFSTVINRFALLNWGSDAVPHAPRLSLNCAKRFLPDPTVIERYTHLTSSPQISKFRQKRNMSNWS